MAGSIPDPTPIERARGIVLLVSNHCGDIRDPVALAADIEKIILDTVICERRRQVQASRKRGNN